MLKFLDFVDLHDFPEDVPNEVNLHEFPEDVPNEDYIVNGMYS